MLEQTSPQAMLFFTLYGGAAVTAFLMCLYLLLSKVNVIAPGITPPVPLRRWAAALFGLVAVSHGYWLLAYASGFDEYSWLFALFAVFDGVGMLITLFGTMLSMLQDRRRPLSPFVAATVPIVVLGALQMARSDIDFITPIIIYTLSLYTVFTVYMTNAVRQYRRWLRDHYADLEHKEVWASHTLLFVVLLLLVNYGFADDTPSFMLVRLTDFVLFALLLWRVETLQRLKEAATDDEDDLPELEASQHTGADLQGAVTAAAGTTGSGSSAQKTQVIPPNIGDLLKENCEKTGLYLMNDLTLAQLSAAVGVNRSYLSQYFSSQGMNYNTYINGLRINHFVSLYQKAVASQQYFTAQQLAQKCGYRSYSTFSTAFKLRMGQSVSAWMRDTVQDVAG